jgi:hypothetical protein
VVTANVHRQLNLDGHNALTSAYVVETMGLEPTTPCLQSTGTGFTGSQDTAFKQVSGLVGPRRTTLVESELHI